MNNKLREELLYSSRLSISPGLLTLVRADASEDRVHEVLESLNANQAWNSLLAEADRQGVTPLLYSVVSAPGMGSFLAQR